MQQDDFRALLNAPRPSGSGFRFSDTPFGSRRPPPGKSSGAKDALSLAPRSHAAKGKSSSRASSASVGASGSSLRNTGPRLGVDKMLDIVRETNPDMTEEQLRQLAGEGGPRGLDLNYIAQAKQQEADRQNALAESALDDMLEAPAPEAPKKRSRDELLRSLREKNGDKSGETPAEVKPSKFRKVGEQPKAPEASAPSEKPKKKKLKKQRKVEVRPSQPQTGDVKPEIAQPGPPPADPSPLPIPTPISVAPAVQAAQEDADDDDIFAGEADYSGLSGSESDDEAQGRAAKRDEDQDQPAKKQNATWFDDDQDEEAEAIAAPAVPKPAAKDKASARDQDGSDGEYEQQRSEIRAMLDADKAAERDEKRKERKLKYREKAGLGNREYGMEVEGGSKKKEKKLTDKDKLNRDYQQIQSRMNKGSAS